MKKILFVISSVAERSRFLHFGRNDILLVLACVTVSLCHCVTAIHAQSVSLSVSPPVVEILLSPNKKVSQKFALETTGESVALTPELHLAKPSDADGHVTIDPDPVNPTTIPLAVTITGPASSPTLTFEAASTDTPQDVYLALVFKASSNIEHGGSSTQTIPAISSLILVTITPTGILPISLDIQDFSPPIVLDSWSPLAIHPVLQNHSSTMIRPLGEYSVISPTGQTVFSLPLYPNLILGNSSRLIQGASKDPTLALQGSDLSPSALPLSWQPHWSNIGPYRLHLTVTSQGGTKLTEVEKVVWLFPIRLSILLLLFLIITSLFIFKLSRKIPT